MTKKEKIRQMKKSLFSLYPNALTELYYNTEFQLLVAIIMSAQSTDKQVNKINKYFFEVLKNPLDGVNLWEKKIKEFIKSISFFNNKSHHIFETSRLLVEKYNSKIPSTLSELVNLPWVGIKTAKVFLSIIYRAPYLAVDTHVHRVLNRIGIVKTKTPLATNNAIEKIFTAGDNVDLHHSLVLFGRYHCIARKPKCLTCQLNEICDFYKKNIFPEKKDKSK